MKRAVGLFMGATLGWFSAQLFVPQRAYACRCAGPELWNLALRDVQGSEEAQEFWDRFDWRAGIQPSHFGLAETETGLALSGELER